MTCTCIHTYVHVHKASLEEHWCRIAHWRMLTYEKSARRNQSNFAAFKLEALQVADKGVLDGLELRTDNRQNLQRKLVSR
jgi:hypothetical protein